MTFPKSRRAGRDARQDGKISPPPGSILPKRVVDSIALGRGGTWKEGGLSSENAVASAGRQSGIEQKSQSKRAPVAGAAELRKDAEAILGAPDLWRVHGFAHDVLNLLASLPPFRCPYCGASDWRHVTDDVFRCENCGSRVDP